MKRVLLAAGGTGGHIYPAISVAKALESLDPEIKIHFWGATKGLENKIVPENGYPLHRVWIGRLNSNVNRAERLLTLALLPFAILRALFLLLLLRPKFVLGMGGHASAPLILAAKMLGVKRYIWEANAHPGLANRLLSRYVDECFLVIEAANKYMSCKKTFPSGMPVREQINIGQPDKTFSKQRKFRIFVFGGSQGSLFINNIVADSICGSPEWLQQVEFIHQTGPRSYPEISQRYTTLSLDVDVRPYISDMEKCYAWADLVVCRGGISTVSELAATGCPAVLIPLPSAADNHQQKNAEVLDSANAGKMVLQSELDGGAFRALVDGLRDQPELLEQWSKNIKSFHRPKAAIEIAEHLLAQS